MVDSTSSVSQEFKSAIASKGLPDPRFRSIEGEESPQTAKRKTRKSKRRHRRTRKSMLKLHKVR